jgi:tetratricopeptide (TPR) repeat protein
MRDAGIGLAAKLVLEHKLDQAKDVFSKLLNLRPDDVEVMTLHANIYFFEGKLLEAENMLNQVLTLNPDYPLALYFLGVVYHEKGEHERAIQMYETVLKHFSDDKKEDIADVYQNMGCSLWEDKIMPKWGAKLKIMKTADKVKLFKDTESLNNFIIIIHT